MSSVIIFGGSGFIGTHLSKKLLEQGESVIVADVVKPRFEHESLSYEYVDVRNLADFTPADQVSCIYNLAAIHTTPGHPHNEYYETNVLGAMEVCGFAERQGINEVVFTSSISVYGPSEDMKEENSALNPNSAYGYSKMIAEKIHRKWMSESEARKLTIVRPAVVFGPGEGGNFTRLASMLKKGVFVYPGRKDTIKSCIYVEDLLSLMFSAKSSKNNFELLNGAYPQRYTLQDIITAFKRHHFPAAKEFMVPKAVVLFAAKTLGLFNFLNIGIHPDRVLKLVHSTNVYPSWIGESGFSLDQDIDTALERWSRDTDKQFN